MSGLEAFAVVGAVAAVISAYRDGGRIVAEIKEKRARKKAPPPTIFLEQSLSRGPPALEEARNNGIERFGPPFAIGDSKSCQARCPQRCNQQPKSIISKKGRLVSLWFDLLYDLIRQVAKEACT